MALKETKGIIVTSEIVRFYADTMFDTFDIEVRSKSNSTAMQVARPFTGMSVEAWLRFSTLLGGTLYADVEFGVPGSNGLSLAGQLCLVTHECNHRHQDKTEGAYKAKYLISKSYRCNVEYRAYMCNMAMYHYLTGGYIPPRKVVDVLRFYNLRDMDIIVARSALESADSSLKKGAIPNVACVTGFKLLAGLAAEQKKEFVYATKVFARNFDEVL